MRGEVVGPSTRRSNSRKRRLHGGVVLHPDRWSPCRLGPAAADHRPCHARQASVVVIQARHPGAGGFRFGLPAAARGAGCRAVEKGGTGRNAPEIESGDVILKLNGQPLKDSSELAGADRRAVAPGTSVNLEIWRNHARGVEGRGQTRCDGGAAHRREPPVRHQEGGKAGDLRWRSRSPADEGSVGPNMKGRAWWVEARHRSRGPRPAIQPGGRSSWPPTVSPLKQRRGVGAARWRNPRGTSHC